MVTVTVGGRPPPRGCEDHRAGPWGRADRAAGALGGGLADRTLGLSLAASVAVQSVLTAAALGVMTYSLYAEGAARRLKA